MNLFWDSCVFIRFLTQTPTDRLGDISQFIQEAKTRKIKIWTSSIVLTEIRPRYLNGKYAGSLQKFFSDFESAFNLIDPNPAILIEAGKLRDIQPVNPSDPKTDKNRSMGTGDSIHLATAIMVKTHFKVDDLIFHTFDKGRGATWEGKCVPMIGLERWYPEHVRSTVMKDACDLTRCEPIHPSPDIATRAGQPNGKSQPQPGA